MVDIVTLGETMLRLSPVSVSSLEESQQFQVDVAGAESNVAVGLARMGLPTGWISKLVDNAVGRLIAKRIAWHGVDISRIVWSNKGRNGLYYLEPGTDPRPTKLIYDRAGSAFTTLGFDQLDWQYIAQARLVHLSGITPALGKKSCDLVIQIADKARRSGILVSIDINYRNKLWSAQRAKKILSPIAELADVLICSIRDAVTVFGINLEDSEKAAVDLQRSFGCKTVVLTLGDEGALAFSNGETVYQRAYEAKLVDRIGRGDCFSAGFLYGYLKEDIPAALKYGNAMAALNQTTRGDFFWCSKEDVDALIAGISQSLQR